MTISRGKQHSFLGMDITFNPDHTVTIHMPTFLDKAIDAFGKDVGGPIATPATKELFDESPTPPPLTPAKQEHFHSIGAKLLYVAHHGRPDLQPTIPYLCTRVAHSTAQDGEKLCRLLRYLKGTRELTLTLEADQFLTLQTWVDASYVVDADAKSHTGGAMSVGRGAFCCKTIKQKPKTKSSTEAELEGIGNYLPNTIWARMLLEAQGHIINNNVLILDNQSAIHLTRHGCASAGQKSRHIDILYFFVKDRVQSEPLKIEHCPTLAMLANFFTKPLQGALFRKLRSAIMGHIPIADLHSSHSPAAEERVGEQPPSEGAELSPTKSEPRAENSEREAQNIGRTIGAEAPERARTYGRTIGAEAPERARTYAEVVKRVRFAPPPSAHSLETVPS